MPDSIRLTGRSSNNSSTTAACRSPRSALPSVCRRRPRVERVQRLLDAGVIQVVAVTNPLSLGKRRMAMIGVRVSGPVEGLTEKIENIEGVEYLVVTAGQFDLLCEVLVADDSALLSITNQLRAIPAVVNTETFVYLDLVKQNYEWGAH